MNANSPWHPVDWIAAAYFVGGSAALTVAWRWWVWPWMTGVAWPWVVGVVS